jgi:Flp pilus assembly protein TadG
MDEPKLRKANETTVIASGTRRVSGLGSANAQTMVEFILVLPLFLFLIFAVFDYGRLFLTQMNVEHAIQDAGRFASTGNHLADPKNPGQNLSRVNSIILAAQRAAFDAKITNVQISSLNGGSGSAGGARRHGDGLRYHRSAADDAVCRTAFSQWEVHFHVERHFQE